MRTQRSAARLIGIPIKQMVQSVTAAVSFLRAYVTTRLTPVLGDETGEIASWVVVTALVVAAAIIIVGIVVTKLTTTATNIQTP
jgi:hypothetical protein